MYCAALHAVYCMHKVNEKKLGIRNKCTNLMLLTLANLNQNVL